ncbi:uncharacterized protein [Nicotiana tomentosiformis]|uniref:uncharacterized protein n=1 Tax=Nicotiana tomentosiformis TaxID=4098 RepID=UPI00388C542B
MPLDYISPELIDGSLLVKLDKKKTNREANKWKDALVVYVIGKTPGYNYMKRYMAQNWNMVAEPEVYYHEEGYYIVKFQSMADLNEVHYAGPYSINNKPMILKQWCPEFDFNAEFLTELLLWVKFPSVPMNCWSRDSLSRIASAIGVPKYADECTAKQTRISFARMLIEVNVTKPLPDEVTVLDPSGKIFQQSAIFEWKLDYCEECLMIGHNCTKQKMNDVKNEEQRNNNFQNSKQGPKNVVQTWVPKEVKRDTTEANGEKKGNQYDAGNQKAQQPIEKVDIEELSPHSKEKHLLKGKVEDLYVINNDLVSMEHEGIWLIWDTNAYKIEVVKKAAQIIHCSVVSRNQQIEYEMTIVYGYNTVEQRRDLWQQLNSLSQTITKPWIILGDFNSISSPQDRLKGATVTSYEIKDFTECIQQLMLNELTWKGDYYTWKNKQQGGDRIWSRIDRAFGNAEWMVKYGHLLNEYKLPHISDDCSMMITTNVREPRIRTTFKFFDVWATHENFLHLVEDNWKQRYHSHTMRNIWIKQKELREKLERLNEIEFKGVATRIIQAREDLQEIQLKLRHQYLDELAMEEKKIICQLEKWSMIEESALQQKAMARWIKLGDANTSYFSAVIKDRK